MTIPLTYSDALTRHAHALAHVEALDAMLALYGQAYLRDPERFVLAPTPIQANVALLVLATVLKALDTEDFREVTP